MAAKIEGMAELEAYLKDMDKIPQRSVTKAARMGAKIVLLAAKNNPSTPYFTGDLQSGIVLTGEKSTIKGKKVFQVAMDSGMNDVFVKYSKAGKRAYYPASQEYGFVTRNGGKKFGLHFMKKAAENNSLRVEREMVDVLSKEIDKLK